MSNVISDLKGIALASRLLRLSELIRRDVAEIYRQHGLDWEPKWSPVLLILISRSPLSVQELADELGYSHPSVIALVKEMETKGFIQSSADDTDKRKRLLSLTPKALTIKAEMQPICDIMNMVVNEITDTDHSLLLALDETEQQLSSQSFLNRYLSKKEPSSKSI